MPPYLVSTVEHQCSRKSVAIAHRLIRVCRCLTLQIVMLSVAGSVQSEQDWTA